MSIKSKTEIKVQKQTPPNHIYFQPKKLHKRKSNKQTDEGYITSLKRIFQGKLFNKNQPTASSPCKLSQQKRIGSAKKSSQLKSKQKTRKISNQQSSSLDNSQQVTIKHAQSSSLTDKTDSSNKTNQTPSQRTRQMKDVATILQSVYLKIKYVKKMSVDSVLIGNENQLDFIVFQIESLLPQHDKKWSIQLDKPIDGVTTSVLTESKILLWAEFELYIYECNLKNMSEQPHQIHKITASQSILSVQLVKRNIFVIICRSHVQIYEMTEINRNLTVQRLEIKQFTCPKHFQIVEIPKLYDNNIKIFFANMHEYEDPEEQKLKDKQQGGMLKKNKGKDVFGLYYVEIEYDYSACRVYEMKKVYDIKKNLRHQIKLLNISTNIFFFSLKTQVLAVKNGLIIDSVGVNFKFDNCYLKIIKNDVLVHVLTDKIEFYHLRLNYDCLPEKIVVEPFDSIYFQRNLNDEFLSIVPINEGYAILFQSDLKQHDLGELKKGYINYWYGLTYPIPLQEKLNQIFPATDKLAQTSFQALETLCDMASKMGLAQNEAYRELWRKSTKQKEKDYQILLASKDYKIIQQEITALLKKRAEKLRLISKNQQICLQFLRSRIFEYSCTLQNLQQFSYCHFFNIKLTCYKHMEVERRRFEMNVYQKSREMGVEQVNKVMELICQKKQSKDEGELSKSIQIEPNYPQMHFNMEDSQILDQSQDIQDQSEQQPSKAIQQPSKSLQQPLKADHQIPKELLKLATLPQQKAGEALQMPNLFATFLKTSKRYSQVEQDRKNVQIREREKLMYQVQSKMKEADYNQIKINIKDYYFFRDCNLKQLFLQTVADLMSKEHTFSDHLKYFSLRVLVNSFKLSFRGIYQDILCQLIATYKHKITRLLEHYVELIPYEFTKTPEMTDPALCQSIWTAIESRELDQCLFLNDITTIENREIIEKFRESLWFKRNNLTHHGVITGTREEMRIKYSEQNMKNIRGHYFYLFISKFLQIKIALNRQINQIYTTFAQTRTPKNNPAAIFSFLINGDNKPIDKLDKKGQEAIAKIQKELLKTNELLKRIQQVYPLIPQHLKGFIQLYLDLYTYLETIQFQEKPYSSIYEFLKLRDFELFKIFFSIQKKIKGFIIKQILKKYENPSLLQNGRQRFIQGIQHYFESDLSEITDLKTILNRLNGQTREFHIQFQALYDCLLSAIMKKIRISSNTSVKLDELLIYVQNIPFSTNNGKIFEKLLLIQEVHLEMETLKRSGIDMSILEIKNSPQIVISALVEAELSSQLLVMECSLKKSCSQIVQKPSSPSSQSNQLKRSQSQQHQMFISALIETICERKQVEIQSVDELKMYFYKCVSELLCIKRHFYGDAYEHLLGFVFVSELMEKPKLVPMIEDALQDEDIKELLSINDPQDEIKFRKALVYYSYRKRLSKHPKSYLDSQAYIKSILRLLPKSDNQRLLIQQQLRYCHIFQKCDYNVPYPLSVKHQLPIMDEIEYHIRQISSDKIDQLEVGKLFKSIETMRELIEPCLDITQRSLDERIKEFQKVLYEFVFFKYLRERKIQLALNIIEKLMRLNPTQNCIIYPIFIIDIMVEQFSDSTSDLIIKLISYFYDSGKQLKDLLSELINIKLTTHEFQQLIRQKINSKIASNSYKYLDPQNYILSQEVQEFCKSSPSPKDKLHLCQLFDNIYRHLQKSSQYIQKKRYYHIIYRIMLFNPYQAAQFIYSKQKNINIKALRGFLSFMSQQFVFSPEIVLKVGAYIFIIMLQRMRDNFLISQQIKEYSKLDLNFESIDEAAFESKFSDVSTLSPMEKLVFESYLAMKAKSQTFFSEQIYESIEKQLDRVKKIYDKDLFLIKKNNIENMQKNQEVSYLKYQNWLQQPKLKYYLHNINEFASYTRFSYLYSSCDKDDEYVMKGINEFVCPRIDNWPDKVQFDKPKQRHEILLEEKFTRIPDWQGKTCHLMHSDSAEDKNNLLGVQCTSSKRERKASSYLPQQFQLQIKQTGPQLHHYSSSQNLMQRYPSRTSFKDEESPKKQIKRTFSKEFETNQQENVKITITPLQEQENIKTNDFPAKPTQKNPYQNKGSNPIEPNSNPILNFFQNGSFFMKQ